MIAIAALAVAGCGGGGEDAETTSGKPVAGNYAGLTSQGLPISFVVTPGAVGSVRFAWRARCADGEVHTNTIALGGARIHYGVFSTGGLLETGGIAHVDGKLEGSKASGVLSRRKGTAFGTNCRATGITWHAEAQPGTGSEGDAV
jgi:hypothetical protein